MIAYIFYRFFSGLIAVLPWSAVYGMSDFAFFILFRVIRYRVDLVRNNFKTCFPDKDEKWVEERTRDYYHYLSDLFLESIKSLNEPIDKLLERFKSDSHDLFDDPDLAGRNIIIVGTHYGNWEYMTRCVPHLVPHEVAGIYRPLSNTRIEKHMSKLRSSEGMWLVPVKEAKESWTAKRDRPVAYGLLADQNPSNPKKAFWINFLNRETGFIPGAEVYAKKYDYPIVSMFFERVKRGHYTVHFERFEMNPKATPEGEIMRRYAGKLEEWIENDPPYWLWSHRRWKHKRPEDYDLMSTIR